MGQNIAIITIRASGFEEERAKFLAAGRDDLVRKPIQEVDIFEAMATHLRVNYVYEVKPGAKVIGAAPGANSR